MLSGVVVSSVVDSGATLVRSTTGASLVPLRTVREISDDFSGLICYSLSP